MKDLIKQAEEIGFESEIWPNEDLLNTLNLDQTFYYLWLCELQKWLIDEKKVLVDARPLDDWNNWVYTIYAEDCMSPFMTIPNHKEYTTRPHALKAGLKEALNLIKK